MVRLRDAITLPAGSWPSLAAIGGAVAPAHT